MFNVKKIFCVLWILLFSLCGAYAMPADDVENPENLSVDKFEIAPQRTLTRTALVVFLLNWQYVYADQAVDICLAKVSAPDPGFAGTWLWKSEESDSEVGGVLVFSSIMNYSWTA